MTREEHMATPASLVHAFRQQQLGGIDKILSRCVDTNGLVPEDDTFFVEDNTCFC